MAWRNLAIVGLMKKIFPSGKSHTEHHEEEVKNVVVEKIKVVEMIIPDAKDTEVMIEKTEVVQTEEVETVDISREQKTENKMPFAVSEEIPQKEEKTKKIETEATSEREKVENVKKSSAKKVEKATIAKEKSIKPKSKPIQKVEGTKTPEKETVAVSKSKKSAKAKVPSKKEQKLKLYHADIKKHLGSVDDAFLEVIVKNLGPSIYRKDAESVACSDPKELETVKNNFLVKKLKMPKEDKEALDKAVAQVCEKLKGVRTKYRATFYYMLAKNLKKESMLS